MVIRLPVVSKDWPPERFGAVAVPGRLRGAGRIAVAQTAAIAGHRSETTSAPSEAAQTYTSGLSPVFSW